MDPRLGGSKGRPQGTAVANLMSAYSDVRNANYSSGSSVPWRGCRSWLAGPKFRLGSCRRSLRCAVTVPPSTPTSTDPGRAALSETISFLRVASKEHGASSRTGGSGGPIIEVREPYPRSRVRPRRPEPWARAGLPDWCVVSRQLFRHVCHILPDQGARHCPTRLKLAGSCRTRMLTLSCYPTWPTV